MCITVHASFLPHDDDPDASLPFEVRTDVMRWITVGVDGTYARLPASDAEVVQEPTEQAIAAAQTAQCREPEHGDRAGGPA